MLLSLLQSVALFQLAIRDGSTIEKTQIRASASAFRSRPIVSPERFMIMCVHRRAKAKAVTRCVPGPQLILAYSSLLADRARQRAVS